MLLREGWHRERQTGILARSLVLLSSANVHGVSQGSRVPYSCVTPMDGQLVQLPAFPTDTHCLEVWGEAIP